MSEIRIRRMVLSICQTNCYLLYREGQKGENGLTETVVIDPGDQGAQIYEALSRKGFHVNAILLTHGHFDHIWGGFPERRSTHMKGKRSSARMRGRTFPGTRGGLRRCGRISTKRTARCWSLEAFR